MALSGLLSADGQIKSGVIWIDAGKLENCRRRSRHGAPFLSSALRAQSRSEAGHRQLKTARFLPERWLPVHGLECDAAGR